MSRAMIGIENSDESIDAIYCCYDGQVEIVGWYLYSRFNTEERLRELISLGDIQSIGARIGNKIDFNKYCENKNYYNANKNQVVAYHRDMMWAMKEHHYRNRDDYAHSVKLEVEYIYLYSDGTWYIRNARDKTRFCMLDKRLKRTDVKYSYDDYATDVDGNFTQEEKMDFKEAYDCLFS